jgi:hypothetical protein
MPSLGQGLMPSLGQGLMPSLGQGLMPSLGQGFKNILLFHHNSGRKQEETDSLTA